jgi:hypothetical protein
LSTWASLADYSLHVIAPHPARRSNEVEMGVVCVSTRGGGGGFLLILLIAGGGYFLAVDWSEMHHQTLENPGDYVNSATSAIRDKEYIHNLWPRFEKWQQSHQTTHESGMQTRQSDRPTPPPGQRGVAAADDASNAICSSKVILDTFIRHRNEDLTGSNRIVSISQPSAVYIRGLHDWECRGMILFQDGTSYWAQFGHHPYSSTQYEVFINEE